MHPRRDSNSQTAKRQTTAGEGHLRFGAPDRGNNAPTSGHKTVCLTSPAPAAVVTSGIHRRPGNRAVTCLVSTRTLGVCLPRPGAGAPAGRRRQPPYRSAVGAARRCSHDDTQRHQLPGQLATPSENRTWKWAESGEKRSRPVSPWVSWNETSLKMPSKAAKSPELATIAALPPSNLLTPTSARRSARHGAAMPGKTSACLVAEATAGPEKLATSGPLDLT
ncbi:unnamed protein product [Protopolystoma xenopodis]|uniref:Uncharacterized protein n=1 Tax=Protopolystoma xenopodis TaxID=117903 RepID=A0A3S5AMY7_9PLAT|nr:unnamed protein product [Protopolystoma xenopodis]